MNVVIKINANMTNHAQKTLLVVINVSDLNANVMKGFIWKIKNVSPYVMKINVLKVSFKMIILKI